MKNSFGNNVSVTVFGESHGSAIGAVIDGLPAGLCVDMEYINAKLALRRPSGSISTSRVEADKVNILSGVFNDRTTGTAIALMIENTNTHSSDYSAIKTVARPGHADYTAQCKYGGYQDYRGGGHFSGRVTAAIVAAGAVIQMALEAKGIKIGSHIKRIGNAADSDFSDIEKEIDVLNKKVFATLDEEAEAEMRAEIMAAKAEGDSIGGIVETAVVGVPAGVGEPFFDSLESVISHAVFSVPAVKGIEFGMGFKVADKLGSEVNDSFVTDGKTVRTETNNNGGINGGISNGMPIVFRCAVKPTPTIFKKQRTVDFEKMINTEIQPHGRHDPCIVHRARAVIDSVTAIAVCDMMTAKFGIDWLGEK